MDAMIAAEEDAKSQGYMTDGQAEVATNVGPPSAELVGRNIFAKRPSSNMLGTMSERNQEQHPRAASPLGRRIADPNKAVSTQQLYASQNQRRFNQVYPDMGAFQPNQFNQS